MHFLLLFKEEAGEQPDNFSGPDKMEETCRVFGIYAWPRSVPADQFCTAYALHIAAKRGIALSDGQNIHLKRGGLVRGFPR